MNLENLLVNIAENLSVGWIALAVVIFLVIRSSIKFVPQNRAYVVERFGKFNRTLTAGLNFIFPFIDKVAYNRTLKEQALSLIHI